MYIAERLRQFREAQKLSQGDIERRTGLLRCYISRVENGHTVPAIETLEKIARALEGPMYQLFFELDGTEDFSIPSRTKYNEWASSGKGCRLFKKICQTLPRMTEKDRALLLFMADKMASGKEKKSRKPGDS